MRLRPSLLTLLAVLGAAGIASAQDDPVVAIVDGEKILKSEVMVAQQALPEQYRQVPLETIWVPLLDRTIDQRLLAKAAEKEKLGDDPKVKDDLARARHQSLQGAMVERAIEQGATPEKLQQAYNQMRLQPGFAQEEVHAQHILVATEEEAEAIIVALDKGGDFAKLAAGNSTDPSAKQNAGDLGWFPRGAMVEEFSDKAFEIASGTYGKEPVKSQFGWHVIKVDEKRLKVPSFEEKEPELREQVARDSVTALLQQIRGGAAIQRFDPDGSPKPN